MRQFSPEVMERADPTQVEFLFASASDHDSVKEMIESNQASIVVRRIRKDMALAEFFGLFKRFNVAVSTHDML